MECTSPAVVRSYNSFPSTTMLLVALADGGVGSIGFVDCAVEGDAAPPPPHAARRNSETTTP
jgi:hypothetical protein